MAQAHTVVEGEFEVGGQEHFYLEGQVAAAIPQEDGEGMTCPRPSIPTEIQQGRPRAAPGRWPLSASRCGGWGWLRRQGTQGNALAVACTLAAHATGKPCKMRYDRDDDMVITGKRHDIKIRYRAGADANKKLIAVDFVHLMRCGGRGPVARRGRPRHAAR